MPYVNKPRPYKHEWELQKKRGEADEHKARARARYEMDHPGKDGKVVDRKGKDINHVKPLSKGGTNSLKNLKLEAPSANRSFYRNSDHTIKVNKPRTKKK